VVPEPAARHCGRQGLAGVGERHGQQAARGSGEAEEDPGASWAASLLGVEGSWAAFEDDGEEGEDGGCVEEERLDGRTVGLEKCADGVSNWLRCGGLVCSLHYCAMRTEDCPRYTGLHAWEERNEHGLDT